MDVTKFVAKFQFHFINGSSAIQFAGSDTNTFALTVAGSSRNGSQNGETLPIVCIISTTIPSYGWRVARRRYEHVDEIIDDWPLPSLLDFLF
jgi:hypothetical protein